MSKQKEPAREEILRERAKSLDLEIKRTRDPWVEGKLRRMRMELREEIGWFAQKEPCSGPGYAHGPHGKCPGYSKDRT